MDTRAPEIESSPERDDNDESIRTDVDDNVSSDSVYSSLTTTTTPTPTPNSNPRVELRRLRIRRLVKIIRLVTILVSIVTVILLLVRGETEAAKTILRAIALQVPESTLTNAIDFNDGDSTTSSNPTTWLRN